MLTRIGEKYYGGTGMIIYLSGKITGNPEFESDFSDAEEVVRREFPGAVILNPARMFPPGMEPRHYIALSIECVKLADMLVLIDGWEDSPGANIEKSVAEYCKIPTIALDDLDRTYIPEGGQIDDD